MKVFIVVCQNESYRAELRSVMNMSSSSREPVYSPVAIAGLKWFLSQHWKHVVKPAVSSSNIENTVLADRVRQTEVNIT